MPTVVARISLTMDKKIQIPQMCLLKRIPDSHFSYSLSMLMSSSRFRSSGLSREPSSNLILPPINVPSQASFLFPFYTSLPSGRVPSLVVFSNHDNVCVCISIKECISRICKNLLHINKKKTALPGRENTKVLNKHFHRRGNSNGQ